MLYLLKLVIGVQLISFGDQMNKGPWWHVFTAMMITFLGLFLIVRSARREERRSLMPHRWNCPKCSGKDSFEIEAFDERVVDAMRHDHNRAVHLLEH